MRFRYHFSFRTYEKTLHSMKQLIFVVVSGLAALTGGCASPQAGTNNEEAVNERVYRTGTNIPTKEKSGSPDGVTVYGPEAAERARDAVQGNVAQPGRTGNGR